MSQKNDLIFHPESDSYSLGEYSDIDATNGCVTVSANSVPLGERLPCGIGESSVIADMDFETYSEAGFVWAESTQKWGTLSGATKKGISAVGAARYAEHPSTELLSLAYDLKQGKGPQLWVPLCPPPEDLFTYIAGGGLIEAWNDSFEYWVWLKVCQEKLGWPALPFWQLRDAAAKARAFALPGKLEAAGDVMQLDVQKDKEGKRLLNKFSIPRNPTKNNRSTRILPEDDPEDAAKLYKYNLTDISAESEISIRCPDLTGVDLEYWLCTRAMNIRGVAIDIETVKAGISILDQALEKYNTELVILTQGAVSKASEVQKLIKWCETKGVVLNSLDVSAIEEALAQQWLPGEVRRALEIRQLAGSAGVKKLYALDRQITKDNRCHDLFIFNGARTGRDTGADVQPQNLVKHGPKVATCEACGTNWGGAHSHCPNCGMGLSETEWSWEKVDEACASIRSKDLNKVEAKYGDALLTLSGVIRGLFIASEGNELICSDYSSIEAVVAACIAGEEWRIAAFKEEKDIYLVSASRITGIPFEEYIQYAKDKGSKHPDRQKIGKPAELGLGFGGWLNGWRQFDPTDTFTDDEVKQNIIAWRDASPAIVEMWGGQVRGKPWRPDYQELYGLEGMAIAAIQNPGTCYSYRSISYGVKDDILYCRLPSGRFLVYHKPRLSASRRWDGQVSISFEGWNTNPTNGPRGWIRMGTFGGRLFENCVQAIANDILRFAVVNLEKANYPIVLRVHDEIVSEVLKGYGTIEEFEKIMGTLPDWAADWPIRAAGGWRGMRYRKD